MTISPLKVGFSLSYTASQLDVRLSVALVSARSKSTGKAEVKLGIICESRFMYSANKLMNKK